MRTGSATESGPEPAVASATLAGGLPWLPLRKTKPSDPQTAGCRAADPSSNSEQHFPLVFCRHPGMSSMPPYGDAPGDNGLSLQASTAPSSFGRPWQVGGHATFIRRRRENVLREPIWRRCDERSSLHAALPARKAGDI